tara:strand:+ start:3270 stop:4295 length:1026 start_codon:yes stop_codon:yes gene_type:complete
MTVKNEDNIFRLSSSLLGEEQARHMLTLLEPMVRDEYADCNQISRAQFASAMNVVLFADIMDRVPPARTYVEDVERDGGRICFDHGALRTVCLTEGSTGTLPRGEKAFRRLLEPMGYEEAAIYPLPALRMTGHAYCHKDHPESMPQFFVSELHVEKFDEEFAQAADRVFGTSRDPVDAPALEALAVLERKESLPFDVAAETLRTVVSAFDRHHERPMLSDYEILKASSGEAAWIATEGNAFNHATDRVPDVFALAEAQKRLGRPMKDKVECSQNGRVCQTAFRAETVERRFGIPGADDYLMAVPGSFHEFITRKVDPETGRLDLTFDAGNATAIFHMTRAA